MELQQSSDVKRGILQKRLSIFTHIFSFVISLWRFFGLDHTFERSKIDSTEKNPWFYKSVSGSCGAPLTDVYELMILGL